MTISDSGITLQPAPAEDTSITVIDQENSPQATTTPSEAAQDMSLLSRLSVFQEYQFIRDQIESFQATLPDGECVAITLPNYPFFTETRLISIAIHQTGKIAITGAARGNKGVTIVDRVETLSFALSHSIFPEGSRNTGVEISYQSQ